MTAHQLLSVLRAVDTQVQEAQDQGPGALTLRSHSAWTAVTAASHSSSPSPHWGTEAGLLEVLALVAGSLWGGTAVPPTHPSPPSPPAMPAAPGPGFPYPVQALRPGHARLSPGSLRADAAQLVWGVCMGGRAQAGVAGMVTDTG